MQFPDTIFPLDENKYIEQWSMGSPLVIAYTNENTIILSHHLWQMFLHFLWSYWSYNQGLDNYERLNAMSQQILPTLPPSPLRVPILCGEISRLLASRLVQSTVTLSYDTRSQDNIIDYS